ncbi:MAG: hypothetical protein V5A28_12760 [Haloarculaceae archaeon]
MSDAAASRGDLPDVGALVADLSDAHDALERARRRVAAVGESELETLRDRHDELTGLFDRYEERVTGDGDFQTFIEFQGKIAEFTEELPGDLRHRDVFEDVDDLLQQRRLTDADWRRVRETLEPVREDVDRLVERREARERYRDARAAVERRRSELADRIDDLEHLQRLGEADLEAPTERLHAPIERYNARVTDAFDRFTSEAGARTVLSFLAATEQYPLVDFRSPPADLREYVETHEPGTEPVPRLLEYSEYSRSKLDHYVADADALKRNVATHRTFLRRLDAEPLTVSWPPPSSGTLRYRTRELESVVARVVAELGAETEADPLVALRDVRALPRETEYDRLRESARARAQLGAEERERLASGAVATERAACRTAGERLDEALATYSPL